MEISSFAKSPFRVGFLLVNGFALMSYSGSVEMLRAANLLARRTLYEIQHIPAVGLWAVSSSGALIEAPSQLGNDYDFDLVIVVAGGDPMKFSNQKVFEWIRKLSRLGVQLGGVSGGPVILAHAGVMAGRRMTVHWEHSAALAQKYPSLMLERSIYVNDRDRVTCAGGVAPLDLMHVILTEHHGTRFARQVSDWFMHTIIRSPGEPQRSGIAERYGTKDTGVILSIEIMENHLADPLTLGQLARLVRLSSRQLNRLFRKEMGKSTMAFYRDIRLEKARTLLEKVPLKILEVALTTGFANSSHFSNCFRRKYNFSPSFARSHTT